MDAAPLSAVEVEDVVVVAMVLTRTRSVLSLTMMRRTPPAHLLPLPLLAPLLLPRLLPLPVWISRRNADDTANVCIYWRQRGVAVECAARLDVGGGKGEMTMRVTETKTNEKRKEIKKNPTSSGVPVIVSLLWRQRQRQRSPIPVKIPLPVKSLSREPRQRHHHRSLTRHETRGGNYK